MEPLWRQPQILVANGIPPDQLRWVTFPNAGNPNTISAQRFLKLRLDPVATDTVYNIGGPRAQLVYVFRTG